MNERMNARGACVTYRMYAAAFHVWNACLSVAATTVIPTFLKARCVLARYMGLRDVQGSGSGGGGALYWWNI